MSTESVATLSLIVSVVSIAIAAGSLAWTVRRDLLRPRLRVTVGVGHILGGKIHPPDAGECHIRISVLNLGPGEANCQMLDLRLPPKERDPKWLWLRGKRRYAALIHDWQNPLSGRLPQTLKVGEKLDLLFGFGSDCFLTAAPIHVGVWDSFGRTHWAPRREVKQANIEFEKQYGKAKESVS